MTMVNYASGLAVRYAKKNQQRGKFGWRDSVVVEISKKGQVQF